MSAIENFCSYIIKDIKMVSSPVEEAPNIRDIRIGSLALRAIGLVVGAVALTCAFGALGSIIVAPASAVASLITAVFLFTIAHDLIIVGHNKSEILNSLSGLGGALWNHMWGLTPRDYQGTWVVGPIYEAAQQA